VTAVGPVDGAGVSCGVLKRTMPYQSGSGSTSRTMWERVRELRKDRKRPVRERVGIMSVAVQREQG